MSCQHQHGPLCHAGCELCERMAYYGIATNLVVYLTVNMSMSHADSATYVSNMRVWARAWA